MHVVKMVFLRVSGQKKPSLGRIRVKIYPHHVHIHKALRWVKKDPMQIILFDRAAINI